MPRRSLEVKIHMEILPKFLTDIDIARSKNRWGDKSKIYKKHTKAILKAFSHYVRQG